MKTTKAMQQIESREDKPIKDLLLELFDKHGRQTTVASSLGINQGTLSNWLLRLGLEQKTVLIERKDKS